MFFKCLRAVFEYAVESINDQPYAKPHDNYRKLRAFTSGELHEASDVELFMEIVMEARAPCTESLLMHYCLSRFLRSVDSLGDFQRAPL